MFFAKKLISAFLQPTTVSMALILVGLLLLWLTQRAWLGRLLATCGFCLLLLASYIPLADAVLVPLERRYAPLFPRPVLEKAVAEAGTPVRWIVVLGGGHILEAGVPANDQIGDSALSRLVEAIRLHRELPGTRILLSGGVGGSVKHADVLGEVARILGLGPDSYVLDRTAWDTEQEAKNLAERIGGDPFILVTSAIHMPRAMALFRKAGTSPIAAPTHHFSLDEPGVALGELLPDPSALGDVDDAAHEYLGMLWSLLRDRI